MGTMENRNDGVNGTIPTADIYLPTCIDKISEADFM